MTRLDVMDRFSAVVFPFLPHDTAKEAQAAHRVARAIADAVIEEAARLDRTSATTPAKDTAA